VLSIHYRLIIYYLIYVQLTLILAKVCPYTRLITVRETGFLEVVIGPEGIKMEKEKVKGVLEWLTLKCVKDIQKFLGLANYYCQFIQGFASIARLLHDTVKKTGSGNGQKSRREHLRS